MNNHENHQISFYLTKLVNLVLFNLFKFKIEYFIKIL